MRQGMGRGQGPLHGNLRSKLACFMAFQSLTGDLSNEMSDKVLDFHDCLLRRQDALLLRGPHWLNDQLIDFFFEFLAREAFAGLPGLLLVNGSAAFLLAQLGPDGGGAEVVLAPRGFPQATRLALFAVNDNPDAAAAGGGSHWSLLAWSAADSTFRHYDSMSGSNGRPARRVAQAAAAAFPSSRFRFHEQHTPQQDNGYDCGVHALVLARLLCQRFAADGDGMSFEVAAEDCDEVGPAGVAAMRQEVYALIAGKAAAAGTAAGLPPPDS